MTISEYMQEITKEFYKYLEEELEKSETKWNNLKKWLKEMKLSRRYDNDVERFTAYGAVLDKMNELEGKDKNDK